MNRKTKEIVSFLLDRLGESSTWQGIGFVISLFTSRYVGLDWGQGAAIGGIVSAVIKIMTKG